jgi:hypothetical protein
MTILDDIGSNCGLNPAYTESAVGGGLPLWLNIGEIDE